MFWWIIGGIVLFYAFALLMLMALCKAASDADDWSERWYEEYQQQQQLKTVQIKCGEEHKWN